MSKDFLVFLIPIGIFLTYWLYGNEPRKPTKIKSRKRKVLGAKPINRLSNQKVDSVLELVQRVKNEFRGFIIIEKFGQVLICEADTRGLPRELVFIRLNPSEEKLIQAFDKYVKASYKYVPTGAEMRKDFAPILNKYR